MKLNRFGAIICLLTCFQSCIAFACRFTVREIGYVDLGDQQYLLYGCIDNDTPAEVSSAFTKMADAVLIDSNIVVEVVNADEQKDHPAMKYLGLWRAKSFPAAVLLSPDGQSLPVPVAAPNRPFRESLRSALQDIVSSPKRDEIIQHISHAFAVVLLIEGTDAEENRKAHEAASAAIRTVADEIKMMPTPVLEPPALVVLNRESFPRERILFWSLGLDKDKLDKPHAAILYGKVRWIGPLMKGEEISQDNILGILSVVAADCECGFDISWTRGTMLPIRWGEQLRARTAKALGFDPENPMVKMEVSGILKTQYFPSGAPFGYVELDAEPGGAPEPANVIPGKHEEKARLEHPPVKTSPEKPVKSERALALRKPLYLFAGLAAFVIVAGVFILLRANARNP